MKQNVTNEELTRLAIAVAELPFIHPNREPTDYMLDVMETVINFHIQTPVVVNSLTYFREQVQQQQAIHSHQQLQALLASIPNNETGNTAASLFLWNNRLWTRIELLRRLLNFFESIAVIDQASLHAWVKTASFELDWKNRVKGLGIAVFEWLKIRCGVDTIKPDIWVINFAKRVVGRKLSEQVLVDCFSNIAPLVGEKMTTLDVTIWFFEHNRMATTDSPGLRLIAWHTLQTELKEKLAQTKALNDFAWQVVLDDRHLLRYQAAGLTMTPNRSWFGTDTATTANSNSKSKTKTNANARIVPSKTSLRLHQSNWTEGLWLELHVCHAPALPIPLLEKLQQHLAGDSGSDWDWDWEIVNDSQFIATLDMEQNILMNPAMTLEELAVWVTQLVGITIDAITQLTLRHS